MMTWGQLLLRHMRSEIYDYLIVINTDPSVISRQQWHAVRDKLALIAEWTDLLGQVPDLSSVDTEWLDAALAIAPKY